MIEGRPEREGNMETDRFKNEQKSGDTIDDQTSRKGGIQEFTEDGTSSS
jgi:hypothetical protein